MTQQELQTRLDALKAERAKVKSKVRVIKDISARAHSDLEKAKRNIESLVNMRENLRQGPEVVSLSEFKKSGTLLRSNREQLVERSHEIAKLNKQIQDAEMSETNLDTQIQDAESELASYGQVLEFVRTAAPEPEKVSLNV